MSISRIRRLLYRSGSVLGDVEAVASGKPDRMIKRVIRKELYRDMGRAIRGIFR